MVLSQFMDLHRAKGTESDYYNIRCAVIHSLENQIGFYITPEGQRHMFIDGNIFILTIVTNDENGNRIEQSSPFDCGI